MSEQESKVEFFFRKLQSLSGFLPLVIFLCFHLIANAVALISPQAYLSFIVGMGQIPGVIIAEVLIIFLPLIVHGVMGLYIVLTGRNNPLRYKYFRNWAFMLQRISGVVIFAFLIWHIVTIKFGSEHNGALMIINLYNQMHFSLTAVFYIISLICVSFHVCNGLWGFAINWGILVGARAQRVFGYICIVLFVILLIFWLGVFMAISGFDAESMGMMKYFADILAQSNFY